VLGAAADEVRARAELSGAIVVVNPEWAGGMGSSLRTGLAALAGASGAADPPGAPGMVDPPGAPRMADPPGRAGAAGPPGRAVLAGVDAACVLLVDTPGITAAAVRRVAGLAAPGALAMATYHGEPGHPVLLGRDHWGAVAELAVGDVGARRYLARHPELVTRVPCEDIAVGDDRDVPPPPH
jgi:nicotine blue oxidoreductase